jgi:4-amino-4-deoxy-L-arabinose transferase-like glycosyltransferase
MRRALNLSLIIILSLVLCFLLYHQVLTKLTLPTWDEAHNSYYGYLMFRALKSFDLNSVWSLVKEQVFYPPLQSVLIAFFSLLFGFSIQNIRVLSLIALPLITLLLFQHTKLLSKKHHQFLAVSCTLLLLTSPMILFFSCVGLKEALGVFLTLLSFQLFFSNRSLFSTLACGISLFALFMLKYNYGLLLLGVFAMEFLLFQRKQIKKGSFWAFISCIFLPSVLGMFVWSHLGPGNAEIIINYLKNPWAFTLSASNTLGHLLFIPLSLVSSYFLSPILALFLFLGLLYTLKEELSFKKICSENLKTSVLRVHTLLFLSNAFSLTFHFGNQQERFLITSFPSFILIGSYGFLSLFKKLSSSFKSKPAIIGLCLSLIIFINLILLKELTSLGQLVRQVGSRQMMSAVFNQADYQDSLFTFNRRQWSKVILNDNQPSTTEVMNYIFNKLNVSKPIKIIGAFNELSPLLFKLYQEMLKDKRPMITNQKKMAAEYLVALEVLPESPFYTHDYLSANAWQLEQIKEVKNDQSLSIEGQRWYKTLGLKVNIFSRP